MGGKFPCGRTKIRLNEILLQLFDIAPRHAKGEVTGESESCRCDTGLSPAPRLGLKRVHLGGETRDQSLEA